MSILVDTDWLHAHLGEPGLVILDATVVLPSPRFDGDYRVASGHAGWLHAHIPGARHADLLTDLADVQASYSFALPTPQALIQALANLGAGVGSNVVIYDRADGFWAARLWWMLRGLGIHAGVLDGGFNAWQRAGLPQHSRQPANTP
ncbi:sulfurtransferase, partial [Pseudomonas sp. K5002]